MSPAEVEICRNKFVAPVTPKKKNQSYQENLTKNLALNLSNCENLTILEDFNVGIDNSSMGHFCDIFDL